MEENLYSIRQMLDDGRYLLTMPFFGTEDQAWQFALTFGRDHSAMLSTPEHIAYFHTIMPDYYVGAEA